MPAPLEGPAAVGHLLRRAGFGPRADTWDNWAALPYDDAVSRVLAELDEAQPADPKPFDPYAPGSIQGAWMDRMLRTPAGLPEKLALFWHGHFATSNTKIVEPFLMWRQYRMFREQGAGSFRDLVQSVSRDVAMIRWLDGNSNRKGQANENYARELQELFTLGIGNYTEQDIREIARAFTGWGSRHHDFVFRKQFHDDGEKTVHGTTGRLGGEAVVDLLVALPACSRFIARKMLRFFSHPDPSVAEVEALATVFRESKLDTRATLEHLFRSTSFRDRARHAALVKSPTEFCVGALRAVGATEVPGYIHGAVDRMGQILFQPPSVKGWPSGRGWMSSGAIVERLRTAQRIAALPDAAAHGTAITAIALQDEMPTRMRKALESTKAPKARIALVLGSPEFQLA